MIDEIIARECPRYVKKEMCYHNKHIQAIIDTHADDYGQKIPVKQFSLEDKECDQELNKMNFDYENHLRNHFSKVI